MALSVTRLRTIFTNIFGDSDILAIGTALYLAAGSIFLAYVGASPIDLVFGLGSAFTNFIKMAADLMPWWMLPVVAAPIAMSGALRSRLWDQRASLVLSIMMCSVFTVIFGLVKNRMSLAVPFWADEFFTDLDLFLHFGHSPHDLLGWLAPLNTEQLLGFYFSSWVFLATFFPVLLIALDGDRERRRMFIILWMLCWVMLGNVFAMFGMSYGPIFADLFRGGPVEAHRNALELLQRDDARILLGIKMLLWQSYEGKTSMPGSGISAFPSVHVGMATVIGLYISTRGTAVARQLNVPSHLSQAILWGVRFAAILYVATYLVLSVYLGWHYAVDGYASILLIGGAYAVLVARTRIDLVPRRSRLVLWSARG